MAGKASHVAAMGLRWSGLLATLALALGGLGSPASAQPMGSTGVGSQFELAFWQSIDNSNDAALYEAYLARFPNGTFSEIARARLARLVPPAPQAVAPPAPSTPAAPRSLTVPVIASPSPAYVAPPPPPPPPPPAAPTNEPPATAQAAAVPAAPVPAAMTAPAGPAATAPAATPAPAGTLGQLLAALANTQASDTHANGAPPSSAARPLSPGFALPPQPTLAPVPAVNLPASFCSAEARNGFHDTVYAPAVNTAKANNEAAAAYLRQLQSLYDRYQLSHDPDTMNTIVGAARTYEQVAQTTFSIQAALVRQFTALMAVPVAPCPQPAAVAPPK